MASPSEMRPGSGRRGSVSLRVWLQTSGLASAIGVLFLGLYFAATGHVGVGLTMAIASFLAWGLATTPIPCPNCGQLFPFVPGKPWPKRIPAVCPTCSYGLTVAGVRPPLSVLTRGTILVTLTGVLLGGAVVLDRISCGSARPGLYFALGVVSVVQYVFLQIFVFRDRS